MTIQTQSTSEQEHFSTSRQVKQTDNIIKDLKFYNLYEQAEAVRWHYFEIPWDEIDYQKVTPELIEHVKNVVNVEFTTFPGAMNFFREFHDDIDFTQWITVWLFEETKHPSVLIKWLEHFDVSFSSEQMKMRRDVYPVGQSRMGTLCMNIISEMRASGWYLDLTKACDEPVLKIILQKLSGDEARHGTGFYTYAKKIIDTSDNPDLECMRALEMLYVWLVSKIDNRHPAGHFFQNTENQQGLSETTTTFSNADLMDKKICEMFGRLVGVELHTTSEIKPHIRDFAQKANFSLM